MVRCADLVGDTALVRLFPSFSGQNGRILYLHSPICLSGMHRDSFTCVTFESRYEYQTCVIGGVSNSMFPAVVAWRLQIYELRTSIAALFRDFKFT